MSRNVIVFSRLLSLYKVLEIKTFDKNERNFLSFFSLSDNDYIVGIYIWVIVVQSFLSTTILWWVVHNPLPNLFSLLCSHAYCVTMLSSPLKLSLWFLREACLLNAETWMKALVKTFAICSCVEICCRLAVFQPLTHAQSDSPSRYALSCYDELDYGWYIVTV